MTPRIDIDPALVERCVFSLAAFGASDGTGVRRPVYSPAWTAAQEMVAGWCAGAGMSVRYDAVGSVWGRLEGTEGGAAIVSGSHIDTQLPGGRYDGALGVIAGYVAIAALNGTVRPAETAAGSRLLLPGGVEPLPPRELLGLPRRGRRDRAGRGGGDAQLRRRIDGGRDALGRP